MALFIAKTPQYRSHATVSRQIGARYADLRPAYAKGRSIEKLGGLLVQRADEMKKERDTAVVGDLYNQWRNADRKQLAGLLAREGKDAANLDTDYNNWFNESFGEADKGTENGDQQAKLKKMMTGRRDQSLDILARYEAAEGQRYKNQQEIGIVSNATSDARDAGFNDIELGKAMQNVEDFVTAAHPGVSEEALEAVLKKYRGALLYANMQARIDENPAMAFGSIEQRKEGLGDQYLTLKNKAETAAIEGQKVEARIAMANNPSQFMRDIENEAYLPLLKGSDRLDIKDRAKPIKDAYTADNVVREAASRVKEDSPDVPYDIESRYAEVEKITKDPTIKKAAYFELERKKRLHDRGVKERFDYNWGAIGSALQEKKDLTVTDIIKMPEYLALASEHQRNEARAKAQKLIDQRNREERAVAASERTALAAKNTLENNKTKAQQAEYDKAYNRIMAGSESHKNLGTMSDTEFEGLSLDVGLKNQVKLRKEREKLQKSTRYFSIARQRIDIVNSVIEESNITDESLKTLYQDAVAEYVGDETDLEQIKKKAAEAMQNAVLKAPWYWYRNVEISETTGKGNKVIGTYNGKNVYILPNGKWQVGE